MSRPLDIDGNTTPAPSLRGQDSGTGTHGRPDSLQAQEGAGPPIFVPLHPGEPVCDLTVEVGSPCPSCGGILKARVPRYCGPLPLVHRPAHRRPCWLIVTPDQTGGMSHKILAYHTESARDAALAPTIRQAMAA